LVIDHKIKIVIKLLFRRDYVVMQRKLNAKQYEHLKTGDCNEKLWCTLKSRAMWSYYV